MEILFCFDRSDEQHFGVAVTSLLLNNPERVQTIHIITGQPSFKLKHQLTQLSAHHSVAIELYEIDLKELELLKVDQPFSPALYYRLMAATVLPVSFDKVLYLDANLVIIGAIDELYYTDVSNYSVAACNAQVALPKRSPLNLQGDHYFNHPDSNHYSNQHHFNSGVMLINLDEWRRNETGIKAIALLHHHANQIKYPDQINHPEQDVLNRLIEGNFYPLDPKWNTLVDLDQQKLPNAESVIIHFVGDLKPWHGWCMSSHKQIYWTYLKRSLWSKASPTLPKDLRQTVSAARYIWKQLRPKAISSKKNPNFL